MSKYQISTFCKTFKDPKKCINEETPHYCPLNEQCYSEPMVNVIQIKQNGERNQTYQNKRNKQDMKRLYHPRYNPQIWTINKIHHNTIPGSEKGRTKNVPLSVLDLWSSQSIG